MRHLIMTLVAAIAFLSCSKNEEQKAPQQPQQVTVMKSEKLKTGAEQITEIKSKLREAKIQLAQESKYDCCIEDACDHCAIHEASCPCAPELKKGEHVCTECYTGWQPGKDADERIKKEQVTTSHVHHDH